MKTVLFLVGPPGVGKTSVARHLIPEAIDRYMVEKPKWTVTEHVCAAGHYTGQTFDGADTVPYNGVAQALDYWEQHLSEKRLTIFDGDRFSYEKVKLRLQQPGRRVMAVLLTAQDAVLAERRSGRGSNQNAQWLKGRVTKAQRFFALFEETQRAHLVFETATPPQMADSIRRLMGRL